jgi:hypothetical protein
MLKIGIGKFWNYHVRLASLTELERETILAERRKRIDLLHEHQELKARIGEQLGRRMH